MKVISALCCAFVALSYLAPASAQESGGERRVLDEIVVTTTKRAESAQDVPFAVTPISSEMIEDASILDITDLGFLVPNVQRQAVSTFPGFATLSMRGVGAGARVEDLDQVADEVGRPHLPGQPPLEDVDGDQAEEGEGR